MSSFLLLVHSSNYANQSSRSAAKYAEAVISRGHTVKAIFFYQQGVEHANALSLVPRDELDNSPSFKSLNQQYNIPLLLCVTAAEKRGIINAEQAHNEVLEHHNIDDTYTIAGLAEMAAIAAECHHVVQFK